MKNRQDIYSKVTDSIIAALEQGTRPWVKPWTNANPSARLIRPIRHNGESYRGINVLLLWKEAADKGYSSPQWMTFRQALALKGHVRKGEQGAMVVYADRFTQSATNDDGEEIEQSIPFLRTYTVFNVEQIEGLPAQFYTKPAPQTETVERIAHADHFFKATSAEIVHGGSQPCYVPLTDRIHMPCIDTFRDSESYYSTLAHECTHWTLHPSRLNRDFGKRFGDERYAQEELVAELGAAFLCADLDLTSEPREDHAAYLQSWLKVLKNDKRAIFLAAAHAQKACDFLHARQPQPPKGGGAQRCDEPSRFRMRYRHCGEEWQDTWSCACNSECPGCGAEIEPYDYEDAIPIRSGSLTYAPAGDPHRIVTRQWHSILE